MVSLFPIEGKGGFGILSFGKFASRIPVHFLNGTIVSVFRQTEPEHLKKFDVNGQGRKPFFATNYQCSAHEVVIDRVSKMVGRNSVRFQNDDVLIIFRHGDIPFHGIVENGLFLDVPL